MLQEMKVKVNLKGKWNLEAKYCWVLKIKVISCKTKGSSKTGMFFKNAPVLWFSKFYLMLWRRKETSYRKWNMARKRISK